jgi:AraC family transcriptional regulator, positive regulator of tynA and feaB
MARSVQIFSTQGVPGPRKVAAWNSFMGELSEAVQVLPSDPSRFDGRLIRQRLGSLTLFEVHCASVRISHRRAQLARLKRPCFQVLMPTQSEFTLVHGNKPLATVSPGSFCLIDRTEPYEIIHGDGQRTIGVEFPHAMLDSLLPKAAQYGGSVLRPDSSANRVLGGLLRALALELNCKEAGSSMPSTIAKSVAGFVAAAFGGDSSVAFGRGTPSRIQAYREYTESRLGDGDLRPAHVAHQFSISERYLRMIFQSSGESFSTFLLRIRLERVAKLLRDDYYANHTITGIALECGFNGASHFGQSFRRHFGRTPRDFRAERDGPEAQ